MTVCWKACFALSLLFAIRASCAYATPVEDCNSTDPAKMLSGCTAVLATAKTPEERLGALARRGFAEKASGKCDAAIADFSAALQLAPNTAAMLTLRGECYGTLNQAKRAYDDFAAALRLDPQNAEARAALSRLSPTETTPQTVAPAAAAPNDFDGVWSITEACPPVGNTLGYVIDFTAQVADGAFHAEHGVPGQPGSLAIDGKIATDGNVSIKATGIIGDKAHTAGNAQAGTPFAYDVDGRIAGTSGTGKRKSARACDWLFAKQPTAVADLNGIWQTADGRSLSFKQVDRRVSWEVVGPKGHESRVGSVSGTFDGRDFVGMYRVYEGAVEERGTVSLTLVGDRLDGAQVSLSSPGQMNRLVLTRMSADGDLTGQWKTATDRVVSLVQTGNRVTWTTCCRQGHPNWTAAITGTFDGKNLTGTFEWREGDARGSGDVSYVRDGDKLKGVLKISGGDVLTSELTRQ